MSKLDLRRYMRLWLLLGGARCGARFGDDAGDGCVVLVSLLCDCKIGHVGCEV